MSADMFEKLEEQVVMLLDTLGDLKRENLLLKQENEQLMSERSGLKTRIDSVLRRLEGV